jgi:hypothetical protein
MTPQTDSPAMPAGVCWQRDRWPCRTNTDKLFSLTLTDIGA